MDVKTFVAHIVADGMLTAAEKRELDRYLLADGQLSAEERSLLAELITKIATGELRVVD